MYVTVMKSFESIKIGSERKPQTDTLKMGEKIMTNEDKTYLGNLHTFLLLTMSPLLFNKEALNKLLYFLQIID